MERNANFRGLAIDLYINDDLFVSPAARCTWPREPTTLRAQEELLHEGCETLRRHLPDAILPSFIFTSRQAAEVPENNGFFSPMAARGGTHGNANNCTTTNAPVSRGDAIAQSIAARPNQPWIIVENINSPIPQALHSQAIFFNDFDDLSDPIFNSYLKDSLGRLCFILLDPYEHARRGTPWTYARLRNFSEIFSESAMQIVARDIAT